MFRPNENKSNGKISDCVQFIVCNFRRFELFSNRSVSGFEECTLFHASTTLRMINVKKENPIWISTPLTFVSIMWKFCSILFYTLQLRFSFTLTSWWKWLHKLAEINCPLCSVESSTDVTVHGKFTVIKNPLNDSKTPKTKDCPHQQIFFHPKMLQEFFVNSFSQ